MNQSQEYRELFRAEALENYEELNRLFADLEKNPAHRSAIDAIFRITHTLKGNAMGMGFREIAGLAHVMEDIFGEVKQGRMSLSSGLFASLFKANDKLGELIEALQSGARVSYRGIQTRLEVCLREEAARPPAPTAPAPTPPAPPTAPKKSRPAPAGPKRKSAAKGKSGPVAEPAAVRPPADAAAQTEATKTEAAAPAPGTISAGPPPQTGPAREDHPPARPEKSDPPAPTAPAAADDDGDDDQARIVFSDLVQVPVRKLDGLLNLVGELIIERDRLVALQQEQGGRSNVYARLQRITSDLQYGIMGIRLVQIGFLFNKFHRIVRDVATLEGKQVDLLLEGTAIEIDRNVLKIMSDSLIHLVRNAVSHGIEPPHLRQQAGKPATGTVTLLARNEKDTVFIDVRDDGRGIDAAVMRRKVVEKGLFTAEDAGQLTDEEVIQCIFHPGFSSADQVTAVSGRGVGMDVVKRATESIGGRVQVTTHPGQGSTITLALPSSMAVKGALLFELGGQEYTIPLSYTEAVVSLYKRDLHKVGNGLVAAYLDKTITVVFLEDLFGLDSLQEVGNSGALHRSFDALPDDRKLDLIVVSKEGRYVGFVVDRLLQQKEIVEKTLGKPLDHVELISGATILGNGNVCLVLDVRAIVEAVFATKNKRPQRNT